MTEDTTVDTPETDDVPEDATEPEVLSDEEINKEVRNSPVDE